MAWASEGRVSRWKGGVCKTWSSVCTRLSEQTPKVTSYLADDGDRKSEQSLEDRDDEKKDEKEEPEPHTEGY